MEKIENAKVDDLGVKISGSASVGQEIKVSSETTMRRIFGTDSDEVAKALFSQCLKVLKRDESSDEHPVNDERLFMVATVRDIAPKDAVERMLAIQMAATHVATIRAGRWLATSDSLAQVQAHYTGFNKLARTFTAQVEALRKHRTGGNQTVTVQHVNVADGGKAIVGNVQTGGRGCNEK